VAEGVQQLTGIGASPGIAIGRAHLLDRRRVKTPKMHIAPEAIEVEIARLDAAIRQSYDQLEGIKQRLREAHGEDHFRILEAHQLILKDEHLVDPLHLRPAQPHVAAARRAAARHRPPLDPARLRDGSLHGREMTHDVERQFTIINELGMHARAATRFVQVANRYRAEVDVEKDGQTVNGKSIMGVLMLVAAQGTVIKVRARGEDAEEAVAALAELITNKFGEE